MKKHGGAIRSSVPISAPSGSRGFPGLPDGSDFASYSVIERLRDGRDATIRAIRPTDKGLIIEALRGLSAESIYYRLFASKREFTDADIREITEVDFVNVVALVALLDECGRDRIVGEGRFIRSGERGTTKKAEVALLIEDAFQGLGAASLLLKHLIVIARKAGITYLEAEVLRSNRAMLEILVRSGFPVEMTATREFVYAVVDLGAGQRGPGMVPAPDRGT